VMEWPVSEFELWLGYLQVLKDRSR